MTGKSTKRESEVRNYLISTAPKPAERSITEYDFAPQSRESTHPLIDDYLHTPHIDSELEGLRFPIRHPKRDHPISKRKYTIAKKTPVEERMGIREIKLNDNLSILTTSNLMYPNKGIEMYREVKRMGGDLSAVSLELDEVLNPFLQDLIQNPRKVNFSDFPGFGPTMDYCAHNKIDLFASDALHQRHLRMMEEVISDIKRGANVEEKLQEYAEFEEQRAKQTLERLNELEDEIDGKLVHLAFSDQAKKIETISSEHFYIR